MRKEETEKKARIEGDGQDLLTLEFKALSQAGTFEEKKKSKKKEREKKDKNMIWAES